MASSDKENLIENEINITKYNQIIKNEQVLDLEKVTHVFNDFCNIINCKI